jgi:hypothetical protein
MTSVAGCTHLQVVYQKDAQWRGWHGTGVKVVECSALTAEIQEVGFLAYNSCEEVVLYMVAC